jgi:hypothetical protein
MGPDAHRLDQARIAIDQEQRGIAVLDQIVD